jgi:hypothetical protein
MGNKVNLKNGLLFIATSKGIRGIFMKLLWPIQAALIFIVLLFIWTLYGVYISMSVSEARYQVLETLENGVEIRAYPPKEIWATTVAEDQNDAFSPLFRYISGDNERGEMI